MADFYSKVLGNGGKVEAPIKNNSEQTTPKGAIGFDNPRDVIDDNIRTKSITAGAAVVKTATITTDNVTTANITTLALSGAATTTYDNSSADTAYIPMVLYNTDATPPAANTVPIGTIYIQYTP